MEITFNDLPETVSQLRKDVREIKRFLFERGNELHSPETEQILTIEEAAELLHVSVDTVRKYMRRHEIVYSRKHKLTYFFRKDIMDWVREGRQMTKREADTKFEKASSKIVVK